MPLIPNRKHTLGEVLAACPVSLADYDFSESVYENMNTKMKVICKKHGPFMQKPQQLKVGRVSCRKCISEKRKTPAKTIFSRLKKKYPNLDFSKAVYTGNTDLMTVICPEHGEFQTHYHSLMHSTYGCKSCANSLTTETFIRKSIERWGEGTFNYDYTEYFGWDQPVELDCPIHGYFQVSSACNHTKDGGRAQGCPDCSTGGFNQEIPATLYYVKIKGRKPLYKIGITNYGDPMVRFEQKADRDKVELVGYARIEVGREARKLEKKILDKFTDCRYTGAPVLKTGNTEIFTRDVLELDY